MKIILLNNVKLLQNPVETSWFAYKNISSLQNSILEDQLVEHCSLLSLCLTLSAVN